MDNEIDTSADAALVAQALERPQSRYLQWAETPDVAQALAQFRSEREIRKTGRLDLVTWVQYICGFGYQGPPDEAWASLFAACRVLPMLGADSDLLREHEIAVLLAYAKIKPDHGDTMTAAQLVKHRIKPAVLGRTVARTPGILQHIHVKFENWALGPFTDMFCSYCVSLCGPSSYMPGIDQLPTTQVDIGDSIRQCADAHANSLLKTWGGVVSTILDIENDSTSQRAMRFEQKLHEKRKFMYQHIFIKISEYWFNLTQSRALVPQQDTEGLHYRQNPFILSKKSSRDRTLFAKEKGNSKLRAFIKKVIETPPMPRAIPFWATVTGTITICELHKPSKFGHAGLEFLQSNDVKTDVVKLLSTNEASPFEATTANVRIGTFNSGTITAEVHGVPVTQMCRALRLIVSVGVLPPKEGSDRPVFEITGIRDTRWVELLPEEDQCTQRDVVSEMNMSDDEKQDEDENDCLNQWFRSIGIGKYLMNGEGCQWQSFDLCEGMSKHNMRLSVPDEVLRRVRRQAKSLEHSPHSIMHSMHPDLLASSSMMLSAASGISEQGMVPDVDSESEGSEIFDEPVWIDCHSAAKLTFFAPPGVELYAATPEKKCIFKKSPFWKSRAP
eukprot:GFKZ01004959.1.p1 GENE.GFKZ01004959.1~~GFKZ01004959.1.p1  ORF type:complete len:636 (+),score=83.74 GFKZ01004959.1:68-1909(+)